MGVQLTTPNEIQRPVKTASAHPVALVSGGASGIGQAAVQELAACGWRVVIADLNDAGAKQCAQLIGEMSLPIDMDVTDEGSVEAGFDRALEWGGRLDLSVHSAGIARIGRILELPWNEWAAVQEVNLNGVFRCMRAAGRRMVAAGSGAIVNISSISAQRGAPGRAAYVASKAAVEALTRTAAVEWAQQGVRVNAVAPGYVDTELIRHHVGIGEISLEPITMRTPMRRLGLAQEIARCIRFLGEDGSSFITGQTIIVDGGFSIDFGVDSRRQAHADMQEARNEPGRMS